MPCEEAKSRKDGLINKCLAFNLKTMLMESTL